MEISQGIMNSSHFTRYDKITLLNEANWLYNNIEQITRGYIVSPLSELTDYPSNAPLILGILLNVSILGAINLPVKVVYNNVILN